MKPDTDLALFVYGSLKPGESNWKRYCEGHVAELHPARVRGRLYKLSDGYLALVQPEVPKSKPETHPWVRGWRLVLRSADVLREIDRLEDFDPACALQDNVYLRTRTDCFEDDDADTPVSLGEAWTYTMTPARLAREGAVEVADAKEQ